MPEPKPLSKAQTELAKLLALFRREEMQPLIARLDAQERELVALRAHVENYRHLGVWSEGIQYRPGNNVAMDGSTWVCLCTTFTRPPSADWILAAKRGRDGRDRDARREPEPEPPAAAPQNAHPVREMIGEPERRSTRSARSNGVGKP